jgi:protein SCO1/2
MRSNPNLIRCGLAVLFIFAGCAKREGDAGGVKVLTTPATPGERRYPLTGEVVAVDARREVLTVRHDPVAGLMPAMTMEFAVSSGDAASARAGERIRAELVLEPEGPPRLEKIWPDDRSDSDAIAAAARALREDTHDRGTGAYREVGEAMPDFALYDQSGRLVQSRRFRGKQIMLNFIFTRCPVATMCPAATAKMMQAQRLAREAGVKDIEFVSITLDPVRDTPGVLRDYAAARGIDMGNFSFLTGPQSAIRDLLTQFGVIAEFQGDFVKHTLATLLIDAQGRIVWRADGSVWEPADFVARMRKG